MPPIILFIQSQPKPTHEHTVFKECLARTDRQEGNVSQTNHRGRSAKPRSANRARRNPRQSRPQNGPSQDLCQPRQQSLLCSYHRLIIHFLLIPSFHQKPT